jgi:tRNA A37 threonylcarbamoyltransferase TsaD
VRQLVETTLPDSKGEKLTCCDENRADLANIAAAFQRVAVAHLSERTARALSWAKEAHPELSCLVVAGGVAANQLVRSQLARVAAEAGLPMVCPPLRLCMDNGVMVAWTGMQRLRLGLAEKPLRADGDVSLFVEVRPKWPIGPRDPRSTTQQQQLSKRKQPQNRDRPANPKPQKQHRPPAGEAALAAQDAASVCA